MTGRADAGEDRGNSTMRRTFVHLLALVGLLLAAAGAAGLLRVALELLAGPALADDTAGGLALGLSLLVVGLPVWLLAWTAARRQAGRGPADARSLPRRLFLAAVRATALAIAVPHAYELGSWLLGVAPYDPAPLARVVVWTLVWASHERIAREVPFGSRDTGRLDRVYVYLVSTIGLVLLAGGVGTVLTRSLERVYDRLVRPDAVLIDAGPGLRTAVLGVVIGGALWWWHWGVRARGDREATGWHVHLFLVGVLGGAATTVIGASQLIHRLVAWLLFAVDEGLGDHFAAIPGAVATLVVGTVIWRYHRAVVRERAPAGAWTGPERAYHHLVVAVGLLTTAGGVATVLTFGMELLLPARTLVESADLGRRALAAGLTLLLVGVPLWASGWGRVQRVARANPRERRSAARRALILGAFGLGTLTSVGALGTLLFVTLEALFSGGFTLRVLAHQRWSVALVLTAGAVSAHYGLVLREDRRLAPEPEAAPPPTALDRITVVAPRPHLLARQLAADLDVAVETWLRRDVGGSAPQPDEESDAVIDLDALDARLRQLDARQALVLVTATGAWEVIPVERAGDGR